MAEKMLFNMVESILMNIGSKSLNEVASAWDFKTRLDKLKNTIKMIKDVLLDAEDRQVESHAVRGWLERLTDVVYAADDLFDEFATVASQWDLMDCYKLSKEVRIFFPNTNQIAFAFNISKEIKNIREELDEIAEDSSKFGFVLRPREEGFGVGRQQRDQTHSYIDSKEVVGRDADKKAIIDNLLTSSMTNNDEVAILPIVGIGGLGKTTLAQLVYNDDEFMKHFELKLWVCVSESFDVEEIVKKIIKSAKNAETQSLEMDQLQIQLRNEVGGKKFLLVLDDVWNENPYKWHKLSDLLKVGGRGSKVLVTTRSKNVARIVGNVEPYELAGLSEQESWALFQKVALKQGEQVHKPNLVKIGGNIVKKCAGVPLVVRTLGASLCGTDESKWLKVEGTNIGDLSENQHMIAILKLSYDHLWSPLKNCFAYCALFPKDYIFKKEKLIDLWMAEGFIMPMKNEDVNEVGEEYFRLLLEKCFFQDITTDKYGNIKRCKMHDLMHDLALRVAGAETHVVAKRSEDNIPNFNDKSRHLSFEYRLTSSWKVPSCMLEMKRLRSFLLPQQVKDGSKFNPPVLKQLISKLRGLRVLDLHSLGLKSLPRSIGKLIHLRYLDLSDNPIEVLPSSIVRLQNLQTLNLYNCHKLEALPIHMRKLTNLISLKLPPFLTHMPSGIGELTSIRKLNRLVVKERIHFRQMVNRLNTAELKDLRNLNNLRGSLYIVMHGQVKDPLHEAREVNLSEKHGLTKFQLALPMYTDNTSIEHDEAILEGLKPHPNLRKLGIYCYNGQSLPSWAMSDNLLTTLPNLVKIELLKCCHCVQLPSFSKLPFLKCLDLRFLRSVKYMEPDQCLLQSTKTVFFPALESLVLLRMDNLKGWWEVIKEISTEDQQPPTFPCLSKLQIKFCSNLISFPILCPNVEELALLEVNKNLSLIKKLVGYDIISPYISSSAMLFGFSSKLRSLSIDDVEELISLPEECLKRISSLTVLDDKLVSTFTLIEVFKSLSSLRFLKLAQCPNLISISYGLEHLSALDKLVIYFCRPLDMSCNCSGQVEDGMPWKALKTLRSLEISGLPKLVNLPSGFQYLTNLRNLRLNYEKNLVALPEWISCLSSLEQLELGNCEKLVSLPESLGSFSSLNVLHIRNCRELTNRCRGPNGEHWSKIQHIPFVSVLAKSW